MKRHSLLRIGIILLLSMFGIAIVFGVLISKYIIYVIEQVTIPPVITAQPLTQAFAAIQSARVDIHLEDETHATVLSGEGIVIFTSSSTDVYGTWRTREETQIVLRINETWSIQEEGVWSVAQAEEINPILRFVVQSRTLDDMLRSLGFVMTDTMEDWDLLRVDTDFGQRIHIYKQDVEELSPWDRWLSVTAIRIEVTISTYNHLPQQIRYFLENPNTQFILTITLSDLNSPIELTLP